MITDFVVLTAVALLSFSASVLQRVTGVDDALFLHVCWYIACRATPHVFLRSPLGDHSATAVVILMYIRLLANAPLLVYLDFKTSVLSKTMTVMMALPTTLFAVIGAYIFTHLTPRARSAVLGISSLLLAAGYSVLFCLRALLARWRVGDARRRGMTVLSEADVLLDELRRSRGASITDLQASFGRDLPPSHFPFLPLRRGALLEAGGKCGLATSCGADVRPSLPPVSAGVRDVSEVYTSTITGDLFTASEAISIRLVEENVPPLTPSKLSPLRTMTFTRVRINRHVDAEGKIRIATQVGAAVAASVGGLLASLTAVSGPPHTMFAAFSDTPHYLVDVSFSAQSIPGGLARVLVAVQSDVLLVGQLPILICAVLFSYGGLFVGTRLGRRLGPRSSSLLVVSMLLLSTLTTAHGSGGFVLFAGVATGVATVAMACWESRRSGPTVAAQMLVEEEILRRTRGAVAFLQRNRDILPAPALPSSCAACLTQVDHQARVSQVAAQPRLVWGGYDNDEDEAANSPQRVDDRSGKNGKQCATTSAAAMRADLVAEVRDSEMVSQPLQPTLLASMASTANNGDSAAHTGCVEEALSLSID